MGYAEEILHSYLLGRFLRSKRRLMIMKGDLGKISRARLNDAEALLKARRYDGAVYLCGYSVEIALKARICKALRWAGYPFTKKEFEKYQSFKTHNLDVLLTLAGVESKIKTNFFAQWSAVAAWDPEARYKSIGTATKQDAQIMIGAAKELLRTL